MAATCKKSETAPATKSSPARKGGDPLRHTILLVEDEDFVRNVACEVLRFAGYEVLPARNATEAEQVFAERKERVALLLSDVALPGRSGGELAQELRAAQPALKVLLISGYPQGRPKTSVAQGSGLLYLEKPFSADALMKKVRHALHGERTAPAPENAAARRATGT